MAVVNGATAAIAAVAPLTLQCIDPTRTPCIAAPFGVALLGPPVAPDGGEASERRGGFGTCRPPSLSGS